MSEPEKKSPAMKAFILASSLVGVFTVIACMSGSGVSLVGAPAVFGVVFAFGYYAYRKEGAP
jgi:hypothetical protein